MISCMHWVVEKQYRLLQGHYKYTSVEELNYRLTMHVKGNILISKDAIDCT